MIKVQGIPMLRVPQADGSTRYWFSGRRKFVDVAYYHGQEHQGWKVGAYACGFGAGGTAGLIAGGKTLNAVVRDLKRRELLDDEEWPYGG